jgi:hypothetical protein
MCVDVRACGVLCVVGVWLVCEVGVLVWLVYVVGVCGCVELILYITFK